MTKNSGIPLPDPSQDNDQRSQYWRQFKSKETQALITKYRKHLTQSHGGFLSVKRRKRLLGLRHKEKMTRNADFWSKLKLSTKDTIIDLQLLCEIASQNQLHEIFSIKEDNTSIDSLIHFILLRSDSEKEYDDLWKIMFIKAIMGECLQYLETSSSFIMTKSHTRLLEEFRDLINALIGISVIMPKGKREDIKFR